MANCLNHLCRMHKKTASPAVGRRTGEAEKRRHHPMSVKSIAYGAGYVNTDLLQKPEDSHELHLRLLHLLGHC